MAAHFVNTVSGFLAMSSESIVGELSLRAAAAGYYQQLHTQTESWKEEINALQNALSKIQGLDHSVNEWTILLEYPIPRRGKRIDVVLLADNCALVLEFKCGATSFDNEAKLQVEDYCLDLRDFHLESRDLILVPILVATKAKTHRNNFCEIVDSIAPVINASEDDLPSLISQATEKYRSDKKINGKIWNESEYKPTPTIVESAQHLYSGHDVKEITRCSGGIDNLTRTSDAVIQAIQAAKENKKKLICFITGVPGAGKTLAGLNIVHNHSLQKNDLGVFLSGNGPLVKVLQEALARHNHKASQNSVKEAKRQVSTFIQNVHHFLNDYFEKGDQIPADKVVIFDEAQRAWDREQSNRKFKRDISEPELMLEIMNRHTDWAVIVALIGGGQEINTGEAGLGEWERTIKEKFVHWDVLISSELLAGNIGIMEGLFSEIPENLQVKENPYLHLSVPLRSYRSEMVAHFVEQLLSFNPEDASIILKDISKYPIYRTRSLDSARDWLKNKQRGTRRTGLIASSGARRLRAHGLDVAAKLAVEEWFLNPKNDVRSSFLLETVCTEFGIQGLELDWTCVCWGGDFVPSDSDWSYFSFRGTKWQNVKQAIRKKYILNKYRVLLTRAREGMVIWVPEGDRKDLTRSPEKYEAINNYLMKCGIPEI